MKPESVIPVIPAAASESPVPPCASSDPVVIRQRMDWIFRGAAPTAPMRELREMVQRYRLEALS